MAAPLRILLASGGLAAALLCATAMAEGGGCGKPSVPRTEPATSQSTRLDAPAFFQRLVDRYRGLHLYRDVVNVVQITQRAGEEPTRVQTQITCELADGKFRVNTPASQARKALGGDLPIRQSQPMTEAQQKYDLWLAPHMALKFTDEPLKQLRPGVDEGFSAAEAEAITIDNKPMVHVELRSGDGLSESGTATVNLYVNSQSMLIERIETEQRLPDGASFSTTLEIVPAEAEGEIPPGDHEPVV